MLQSFNVESEKSRMVVLTTTLRASSSVLIALRIQHAFHRSNLSHTTNLSSKLQHVRLVFLSSSSMTPSLIRRSSGRLLRILDLDPGRDLLLDPYPELVMLFLGPFQGSFPWAWGHRRSTGYPKEESLLQRIPRRGEIQSRAM